VRPEGSAARRSELRHLVLGGWHVSQSLLVVTPAPDWESHSSENICCFGRYSVDVHYWMTDMDKILAVEWRELLIPTHSLAEVIVRGSLMYLGLFLIFRFIVQRQSSAVGIADLIVVVIIADAAQNAFAKEYRSITEGFALVLTVVAWDLVLDRLGYHSRFFSWLVKPSPLPLVKDGRVLRKNLRRELISTDELRSQARQQGISRLEDLESAFLEGNGEISFVKRDKSNQPSPKKSRRKKAT
jgi:uncharacterized membrane protein YcaP (DUF421 family)